MFKFFMVEDEYINFCSRYDIKVQHNKEDNRKFNKKYLGIVLNIDNFKYYIPLSSYKPKKHDNMPESIDFIRIEDDKGKYAVLNINNMLPIPDEAIVNFDMKVLPNNTKDESKYRDLLYNEWNVCKKKKSKILKNAQTIYNMVKSNKPQNIVKRCCDFKLLENVMKDYDSYSEAAATIEE